MNTKKWLMGGIAVLLTVSASAGFVDERSSPLEKRDAVKPIETTLSPQTSTATTVNKLIETMEPPPTPAAPAPAPAPLPATIIERLNIQAGQRLSVALGAWLKFQNIELSWEPSGSLPGRVRDVVIESAWQASQNALEPTLSELLAPFGLIAHVLRQGVTTGASTIKAPTSIVVRNTSVSRP